MVRMYGATGPRCFAAPVYPPGGHAVPRAVGQHDGMRMAMGSLPAWFPRPRFVDGEGAPGQCRAIEAGNRVLRRMTVWHFDEAKTPGTACVAV